MEAASPVKEAMDQSTLSGASIFFSGPIPTAIATSQRENKVLLVYIAGADTESKRLEETTWRDPKLLNEVQQSSIALKLIGGSVDAHHFSALYPVEVIPSITIVGCNGSMLWQQGGYVDADELLQKLQKAGEAMRVLLQNTMAGAILASLSSVHQTAGSIPSSSHVEEESLSPKSETSMPKDVLEGNAITTPLSEPGTSEGLAEKNPDEDLSACTDSDLSVVHASASGSKGKTDDLSGENALSTKPPAESAITGISAEGGETTKSHSESPCPSYSEVDEKELQKSNPNGSRKFDIEPKHMKANLEDVLLQIRLTNGQVIRGQFKSSDCLTAVMDFVDQNGAETGSYSLAIPFPRRVFTADEYTRSLMDLQLESRAALIVVPVKSSEKVGPASFVNSTVTSTTDSMHREESTSNSFVGRALSYLNPFSYWSWFFPDRQASEVSTTWQYDPNPTLGRAARGDTPATLGQDANLLNLNNAQRLQGQASSATTQRRGWGARGNVHTLNQDDDDAFRNGNAYWNGNSTQFGGEDDSKK